jgi:hypothetical protein
LLNVVDAYLRLVLELVKRNPNRARMLRKRKVREPQIPQEFTAPEESSSFSLALEAPASIF